MRLRDVKSHDLLVKYCSGCDYLNILGFYQQVEWKRSDYDSNVLIYKFNCQNHKCNIELTYTIIAYSDSIEIVLVIDARSAMKLIYRCTMMGINK